MWLGYPKVQTTQYMLCMSSWDPTPNSTHLKSNQQLIHPYSIMPSEAVEAWDWVARLTPSKKYIRIFLHERSNTPIFNIIFEFFLFLFFGISLWWAKAHVIEQTYILPPKFYVHRGPIPRSSYIQVLKMVAKYIKTSKIHMSPSVHGEAWVCWKRILNGIKDWERVRAYMLTFSSACINIQVTCQGNGPLSNHISEP